MDIQNEPLQYQNTEKLDKTSHSCGESQHRGVFRLAVLCLGVMCILQAALNITLRLCCSGDVGNPTIVQEMRTVS
ncbi:hypothetical protein MHYP_G00247960 [Metynnis hypsauchen]